MSYIVQYLRQVVFVDLDQDTPVDVEDAGDASLVDPRAPPHLCNFFSSSIIPVSCPRWFLHLPPGSPESQNPARIQEESRKNQERIKKESRKNPEKIQKKSRKNPGRIKEESGKNQGKIQQESGKNPARIHEESSRNRTRILENPGLIHEESGKNPPPPLKMPMTAALEANPPKHL